MRILLLSEFDLLSFLDMVIEPVSVKSRTDNFQVIDHIDWMVGIAVLVTSFVYQHGLRLVHEEAVKSEITAWNHIANFHLFREVSNSAKGSCLND